MSERDEHRQVSAIAFAANKLYALGAPYVLPEIGIVLAIVKRGLARQRDSDDEACFVSDDYIAKHTRASTHTVRRWINIHCARADPVLGRSWPGKTYGTDDRMHLHDCARYTLLRTSAQVAAAAKIEAAHREHEKARATKRKRTTARRQRAHDIAVEKPRGGRAAPAPLLDSSTEMLCPGGCGAIVYEAVPGIYREAHGHRPMHRCAGLRAARAS